MRLQFAKPGLSGTVTVTPGLQTLAAAIQTQPGFELATDRRDSEYHVTLILQAGSCDPETARGRNGSTELRPTMSKPAVRREIFLLTVKGER